MRKLVFALLALLAFGSPAIAEQSGPTVIDCPVGTECRTWMDGGVTYLKVVNRTNREVSGTVTLNEIYEKVIPVAGRPIAAIDGRWIEITLPAKGEMVLRLGK